MSSIDQDYAISLLGGNQRIYLKFLQKFVDAANSGKYELSQHILDNDFDHAARTFHSMKALCENIGAVSIKGFITELDAAAKEGNKVFISARLGQYNACVVKVKSDAITLLN